jgi:hypothetical protein
MLLTYRGVVKNGRVEIENARLPEGMKVVVVTHAALPSAAEQREKLATLSDSEWREPFEAYARTLRDSSAEAEIESLSDAELDELVHKAKHERS